MMPPSVAKVYAHRDRLLRSIGYATYDDYLRSNLWGDIRYKILLTANAVDASGPCGGGCYACGRRAEEVHHANYRLPVLLGDDLKSLYPVCRRCHEEVEFIDGVKLNPSRATARLKKIRKARLEAEPLKAKRPRRPSRQERDLMAIEKKWSQSYRHELDFEPPFP